MAGTESISMEIQKFAGHCEERRLRRSNLPLSKHEISALRSQGQGRASFH